MMRLSFLLGILSLYCRQMRQFTGHQVERDATKIPGQTQNWGCCDSWSSYILYTCSYVKYVIFVTNVIVVF